MSEGHRVKIQNSNILNALVEHVEGKREMSATQVSAGLGLLRKVMPDLATTQLTGDPESPVEIVTRVEHHIVDPSNAEDSDAEGISTVTGAEEV